MQELVFEAGFDSGDYLGGRKTQKVSYHMVLKSGHKVGVSKVIRFRDEGDVGLDGDLDATADDYDRAERLAHVGTTAYHGNGGLVNRIDYEQHVAVIRQLSIGITLAAEHVVEEHRLRVAQFASHLDFCLCLNAP